MADRERVIMGCTAGVMLDRVEETDDGRTTVVEYFLTAHQGAYERTFSVEADAWSEFDRQVAISQEELRKLRQ